MSLCHYALLHLSLNAIVAKLKNCPFGANKTTEFKNVTNTSDTTGTYVSRNIHS
jgi:hypothetical protein